METEGVFGSQAGLALFVVHSNYLGGVQGFPDGFVTNAAKAIVGAAPIVFVPRTLVRTWGTRRLPTPVDYVLGCYDRWDGRGRVVVYHISRKTSEIWGTPRFLVGSGLPGRGPSIASEVMRTDAKGRDA